MPFASAIVAACCALGAAAPKPVSSTRDASVRLNLAIDPSIASPLIRSELMAEATAIWRVYGVTLLWSDCAGVEATREFDVAVIRHARGPDADRTVAVLGLTVIDLDGTVRGPIRILFDPIESLLRGRHDTRIALHDIEMGRALGRVLAHELGHVLLGPPGYHDADGLMRAALTADDLARPDRGPFHLTTRSADRLRDAIGRWLDATASRP